MSDSIISVENLGKKYRIKHQQGGGMRYKALRDVLAEHSKNVARRVWSIFRTSQGSHAPTSEDFWALKDVSFKVTQGEVVGIIGRNGAGKSTLLKILSRITEPTEGLVRIKGRVASLLEVGTGFHPELTGRENIFLNGAILGMHRSEIKKKFDEIVAFSEVEKFIDTPVKRYSSGMYVRLAFSVAAQLEPEILIVDEVLAVGDAVFQKKCLGKMKDVAEEGRTILFVSHNMDAVRRLCSRGIWLRNAKVECDSDVDTAVQNYFKTVAADKHFSYKSEVSGLHITQVALQNQEGEETSAFRPGDDLIVNISYHATKAVELPYFVLAIKGVNGSCFTANMLLDGQRPSALVGTGKISCKFESIPLLPQSYSVRMAIRDKDGEDHLLDICDVADFTVWSDLRDYGYKGNFQVLASRSTHVVVPYEWRFSDGTVAPVSLRRPEASAQGYASP